MDNNDSNKYDPRRAAEAYERMQGNVGPDGEPWVTDEAFDNLVMERVVNPAESAEELTMRLFREASPVATQGIIHLALKGASERVRFEAQKYIVDRTVGRIGDAKPDTDASQSWEKFMSEVIKDTEAHANGGA